MYIDFTLNDERVTTQASPFSPLSLLLREHLDQRSIHNGCRQGFCGQCLVLMDGQAVPACLVPVHMVRGAVVETAEGLVTGESFMDIEKAFMLTGLNPCSHCAGAKTVLAESILRNYDEVTEAVVRGSMPQHWCSCSSVDDFVQAVVTAFNLKSKRRVHARRR